MRTNYLVHPSCAIGNAERQQWYLNYLYPLPMLSKFLIHSRRISRAPNGDVKQYPSC